MKKNLNTVIILKVKKVYIIQKTVFIFLLWKGFTSDENHDTAYIWA